MAMGGELLVINSEEIRQNVALILVSQNVVERYIWIGLYRVNYIWNDGDIIRHKPIIQLAVYFPYGTHAVY